MRELDGESARESLERDLEREILRELDRESAQESLERKLER